MKTKFCAICNEEKTLDMFHSHKGGKFGVHSQCKQCYNQKLKFCKNKQGIYFIYENDKVVYVGSTKNYNRRKINHLSSLKNSKAFNWGNIKISEENIENFKFELVEEIDNYHLVKIKEFELIAHYKPKYNSPYREYYNNLKD
jgi:excinuclease UvrABC nuclease subunit